MKAGENRTTEKIDVLPLSSTATDSNNFSKKSFGKDVGKLVFGTLVAQVIGLCLTPIITRIFSPEIYGVAAVFTSIVSIIVVIACLRYEMAIMLPKDENEAGSILCLCFICLFIISFLSFMIMLFLGGVIAEFLGNVAVKEWLFLIPLAVFIDGLYLAIRYWNTRKKRFGTQAITQIVQSLSGSGLKLAFGFGGFINAGALIVTGIIGNLLGTLILFFQAFRSDFVLIKNSFSLSNIWKVAKRYKKFPLIDTWNQWINTISWQLPVLMLTGFFSSTLTGLYTLGFQILQLPMSLIGSSIGQVFFQRATVAKHNNTLPSIVEDTCSVLLLISICPFLLLCVIGEPLFGLVFGDEWKGAGTIAQILALWTLVWFISSPLSSVVSVLEIQSLGLIMSIINLVTRFLSLFIGGNLGNIYLTIILFGVSGIFVYGICLYLWIKKSGGKIQNIWKRVWKPSILWIGCVLLFAILVYILSIPAIISVIIAVIMGIVYIYYLFKKNSIVKEYI